MITFSMWKSLNSYDIVEHYSSRVDHNELTPADKAMALIFCTMVTPFTLMMDIVMSPFEILFIILRNKYKKQLEGKDNE